MIGTCFLLVSLAGLHVDVHNDTTFNRLFPVGPCFLNNEEQIHAMWWEAVDTLQPASSAGRPTQQTKLETRRTHHTELDLALEQPRTALFL